MAYSATVDIQQVGSDPDAKGYYRVTITETEVSSTDEATLSGVPKVGRVLRQTCSLGSGSGSTIDPILGLTTAPSGVSVVYENGTAAANVNNEPNSGEGTVYYSDEGTLFHRSQPNSGSDNSVTTVYLIRGGW